MKKFIIYTLTFFTCTCIAKRDDTTKLSDTYQRSVSSSSSGAEVLSQQDFSDESSSDAEYTNREPSPMPADTIQLYGYRKDTTVRRSPGMYVPSSDDPLSELFIGKRRKK